MRFNTSRSDTTETVQGTDSVHTLYGNAQDLVKIMQANNQRLFRIAYGVLRNEAEAEDVVQETFIKAFTSTGELRDETRISPWLAKIALNKARDRLRRENRNQQIFSSGHDPDVIPINPSYQRDIDIQTSPERQAAMGDIRRLIESEIDMLPDGFREVFIMREVEQLSVVETSDLLSLVPATVKTRLHRAKALLRKGLEGRLNAQSLSVFPFGGVRCARSTDAVIRHLQINPGPQS